jgi:hypothetical protein
MWHPWTSNYPSNRPESGESGSNARDRNQNELDIIVGADIEQPFSRM